MRKSWGLVSVCFLLFLVIMAGCSESSTGENGQGKSKEMPKASLHPICFEVRDNENDMHARHFSSPFLGTMEDAATGTASGVMGAYYKTFVNKDTRLPTTFIVEQGHEINKDGRVYVHVKGEQAQLDISISGTAVFVKNIEIEIE